MCDADIAYIGKPDFIKKIPLLREEWRSTEKKEYSEGEWLKENIRFLESNPFHTEYAKAKYSKTRLENIALLKQLLEEEK